MLRRTIVAIAAILALAPASATAHNLHLAGHGRIQIRAFMREYGHTRGQFAQAMRQLTPADRTFMQYVLTPDRRLDRITTHTTARTASGDSSCPSFTKTHDMTNTVYGNLDLVALFTYHSKWTWSGMCYVHSASHTEWGDNCTVGWSYSHEQYGAKYGSIPSPQVGRETFGYFNYSIGPVQSSDTVDMQVIVYGGWGTRPDSYWYWTHDS